MVRKMLILFYNLILLAFLIKKLVKCQSASNFLLKDFKWCEERSLQKVQFFVTPRDFNPGLQVIDANLSTPIPLGRDMLTKFQVESDAEWVKKETWISLFTVEDNVCKIIDTFFGQFIYDLERAFGIIPKSCPISKGIYHAINHTLDYNTLKLQTFPFGKIRVISTAVDRVTQEKLWCFIMILWNQPKLD